MFSEVLRRIQALVTNQLGSDDGAGLAEYAMLLLLVAVVCVTVVGTLGTTLSGLFTNASGMFSG